MIYHWKLVESLRSDRQDLVTRQLPHTQPQPQQHTQTHTYKHKQLRVCDYSEAKAGKYCSKSSKLHQSKRKL